MNQLTVMLNNGNLGGGVPAGQGHNQHAPAGYVTFQNSGPTAPQPLSLESCSPHMLTFAQAQAAQPGTFLLNAATPQAFATASHAQQAAPIQYFINSQPQPAYGFLSNVMPGTISMMPQPGQQAGLSFHPQPQQLQLQQGGQQFVTMLPQTPTGTIHLGGGQFIQQQQQQQTQQPQQSFQIIGGSQPVSNLGPSSAILTQPPQPQTQLITNAQGQTQLVITPNSQHFAQHQQQTQLQAQPNAGGQQILQLVLANGQVVQTLQQPQAPSNLIAQPTIQLQQQQQQTQHSTITVPIHTNASGQTILAPNLSVSGQTFIPQQAQSQANLVATSSPPAMFEPLQQQQAQTVTGQVVLHSPIAAAAPSNPIFLSNSATTTGSALHPTSSVSATTMMVLTQTNTSSTQSTTTTTTSTNSSMPSAVLNHKCAKSTPPLIPTSLAEKIMGNLGCEKQQQQTCTQTAETDKQTIVKVAEKTTSPLMMDNGKCSPQQSSTGIIANNNETATQTSIELEEDDDDDDDDDYDDAEDDLEQPSRPLSASSNGSLKIAEEEEQFNETDTETDTTEVMSVETQVDQAEAVETSAENLETLSTTLAQKSAIKCDSPFNPNFTDTEDEEEEGDDDDEEGEGEIRLVRKNGLTKAAYNLINNRILNSEDDAATNTSMDSKASNFYEEQDGSLLPGVPSSTSSSPVSMLSGHDGEMNIQNGMVSSSKCLISSLLPVSRNDNGDPPIVDGVNLKEIQDFAKAFKLCRIGLNLTQSQVGNELSQNINGPCYSQSAICRFEKLDITPKSARKIKPVLEQWMHEARSRTARPGDAQTEMSNKESSQITALYKMNGVTKVGDEPPALTCEYGKKRKRRTSFKPETIEELTKLFQIEPHPDSNAMTAIATKLNIQRDVVRVWFCNKRQSMRTKKFCVGELSPTIINSVCNKSFVKPKVDSLVLGTAICRAEKPKTLTPIVVVSSSMNNIVSSTPQVPKTTSSIYSIATMVGTSSSAPPSSSSPPSIVAAAKVTPTTINNMAAVAPLSAFSSPLFSFQTMTGAMPPPSLSRLGGAHYGSAFTPIQSLPPSTFLHPSHHHQRSCPNIVSKK